MKPRDGNNLTWLRGCECHAARLIAAGMEVQQAAGLMFVNIPREQWVIMHTSDS